MQSRRIFALLTIFLVSGILFACGTGDDDPEPTPAPATQIPTDNVGEIEPIAIPTDDSSPATPSTNLIATPLSSPVATPVEVAATPDTSIVPVTDESRATAAAETSVAPVPVEADSDEPQPTSVPMIAINGTLTFDGRAQQDFMLSDEGCVGLGEWRQLKPGAQVIVRDAGGTVVDIANLEGITAEETCSWTFAIDAPGTDFFSISIPMVTEVWFDQDDPAVESGELELFVP